MHPAALFSVPPSTAASKQQLPPFFSLLCVSNPASQAHPSFSDILSLSVTLSSLSHSLHTHVHTQHNINSHTSHSQHTCTQSPPHMHPARLLLQSTPPDCASRRATMLRRRTSSPPAGAGHHAASHGPAVTCLTGGYDR
ncbi:hypothetical protein PVAP13_2KG240358 [Panicum virgatum]|uniref:Uncharacterized protein n=1 Tax=Panicum virgatum TaxID=38727 RepID=A0A8T0W6W1_PANVG|nr:hypothetical protein PVAP13_2KG240358 [Panicum virgatum]